MSWLRILAAATLSAGLGAVALVTPGSTGTATVPQTPPVASSPALVGWTAVKECGNHAPQDGESDDDAVAVSDEHDVDFVEDRADGRDCFDSLVSNLKHPPITRPGDGRVPSDNTPPKH